MGIYTGHNPSSQDDVDAEETVSMAQYEAIANELDEVYAIVEKSSKQIVEMCSALDEIMISVAAILEQGPAHLFTHYPSGGYKHEN
tara:strand:- start:813 stop:1070 length:258 start_codon:yes stop_codon:yes gene_type:complete